jgi:hypothetical protein
MSGKDASEAELKRRDFTDRLRYRMTGHNWNELSGWLKRTKPAPNRTAAVEKMIGEFKGASTR